MHTLTQTTTIKTLLERAFLTGLIDYKIVITIITGGTSRKSRTGGTAFHWALLTEQCGCVHEIISCFVAHHASSQTLTS